MDHRLEAGATHFQQPVSQPRRPPVGRSQKGFFPRMNPSRIQAVDTVHLESLPEYEAELKWFYGELADLPELTYERLGVAYVAFKSEQIELLIRLCPDPRIDGRCLRVTIAVTSLEWVEDQLLERSCAFQRISGIARSDRSIDMLDPAGNRVRLRQLSRFAPL